MSNVIAFIISLSPYKQKGSAYPALPQRMVNHCYLKVYCDGRLVDKANIIKKRCS